jgi:hypothetical protein
MVMLLPVPLTRRPLGPNVMVLLLMPYVLESGEGDAEGEGSAGAAAVAVGVTRSCAVVVVVGAVAGAASVPGKVGPLFSDSLFFLRQARLRRELLAAEPVAGQREEQQAKWRRKPNAQ